MLGSRLYNGLIQLNVLSRSVLNVFPRGARGPVPLPAPPAPPSSGLRFDCANWAVVCKADLNFAVRYLGTIFALYCTLRGPKIASSS